RHVGRRDRQAILTHLVAALGGVAFAMLIPRIALAWNTLADLQSAEKEAGAKDLPILLTVGADWCVDCEQFEEDVESVGSLQEVFGTRVLRFAVDAEHGDGIQIAEDYHVGRYPSFVLVNERGQTMDRWYGYTGVDNFLEHLGAALADPMTISERMTRFQRDPSAADARKLAELRQFEGLYAEAVAYYRQAQSMSTDGTDYEDLILWAMVEGAHKRSFTLEDVKDEADRLVQKSGRSPATQLRVAYSLVSLALSQGRPDVMRPYLKTAIEASESSDDPKVQKMRQRMLPEYALYIQNDVDRAMVYRKDALPEGWERDGIQLNNLAWWCFENRVRLEEGEQWAKQSVKICMPGTARANALDTQAEIANLRGDPAEAVELMERAVKEAPHNEYFRQQLQRFQEILKNKGR
ncbi:MAG: thioredoxin family protein, partial [Candidatus Eisenbacteria bacterium]|nr:thioredoxin family protein [Candidatus Eisenbacteria bacterium]